MSDALKQEVLDYLRGHNTMTLATCASDVPWASTVFYASDDLRLYFLSAPESRHCQNLSGNSRVGVSEGHVVPKALPAPAHPFRSSSSAHRAYSAVTAACAAWNSADGDSSENLS